MLHSLALGEACMAVYEFYAELYNCEKSSKPDFTPAQKADVKKCWEDTLRLPFPEKRGTGTEIQMKIPCMPLLLETVAGWQLYHSGSNQTGNGGDVASAQKFLEKWYKTVMYCAIEVCAEGNKGRSLLRRDSARKLTDYKSQKNLFQNLDKICFERTVCQAVANGKLRDASVMIPVSVIDAWRENKTDKISRSMEVLYHCCGKENCFTLAEVCMWAGCSEPTFKSYAEKSDVFSFDEDKYPKNTSIQVNRLSIKDEKYEWDDNAAGIIVSVIYPGMGDALMKIEEFPEYDAHPDKYPAWIDDLLAGREDAEEKGQGKKSRLNINSYKPQRAALGWLMLCQMYQGIEPEEFFTAHDFSVPDPEKVTEWAKEKEEEATNAYKNAYKIVCGIREGRQYLRLKKKIGTARLEDGKWKISVDPPKAT